MQALVAFDDLDFTRTGAQVLADERVAFHLDGEAIELDLTTDHAKELRAAFARWIDAAPRVVGGRPVPVGDTSRLSHEARLAYNRGMRAFADARGISYHMPSGQVFYPVALKRAYAAWLLGGR